jgi:hypothetical protein
MKDAIKNLISLIIIIGVIFMIVNSCVKEDKPVAPNITTSGTGI